MSDLTINTTLRDANSVPSRPARSGSGGGDSPAPTPQEVPSPSEFRSSPKGTIDSGSGLFVIQFRDSDGTVTMQYPSSKAQQYERSSSGASQKSPLDLDPTSNPPKAPVSA